MWLDQSFIAARNEVLFLMLIALINTVPIEPSTLINKLISGIVFLFQRKIEWNQSLYSQTVFINVSALIPFSS